MIRVNKHWASIAMAMAVAAVAIACSGYDGAGYCITGAVMVEFFA